MHATIRTVRTERIYNNEMQSAEWWCGFNSSFSSRVKREEEEEEGPDAKFFE